MLLETNGGVDTTATRSIWDSTRITTPILKIAVRIRANRLHTTHREFLFRRTPNSMCPWCNQGPDDADHALNHCNQEVFIRLTKIRHDTAVTLVRNSILKGTRGSHYIHTDARSTLEADQTRKRKVNQLNHNRDTYQILLPKDTCKHPYQTLS